MSCHLRNPHISAFLFLKSNHLTFGFTDHILVCKRICWRWKSLKDSNDIYHFWKPIKLDLCQYRTYIFKLIVHRFSSQFEKTVVEGSMCSYGRRTQTLYTWLSGDIFLMWPRVLLVDLASKLLEWLKHWNGSNNILKTVRIWKPRQVICWIGSKFLLQYILVSILP